MTTDHKTNNDGNTGTTNRSPRVLNKRHHRIPAGAVYCGRPSPWGNPFVIGRDGTRAEVIAKYETWLLQQSRLLARLPELRGKSLVCWCSPAPCHCDVLLRLANSESATGA